jgi:hypothetical protein
MKKILIILITVLLYISTYAQNPQLFENDWYLQKVIIDDIEYFPPINPEVDNVLLYFSTDYNFLTQVCESIGSEFITAITNDFFIVDSLVWLPDGTCDLEETIFFQGLYLVNFFNWQGTNINFSYNIETGAGGFKTLTLTNSNEDIAIYGNALLSNQDFDVSEFTLFPNPATNKIIIENSNQYSIIKINIYDTLGRLILVQSNPSNQIDISSLPTGLLFVQIETDKGSFVKKVVKE